MPAQQRLDGKAMTEIVQPRPMAGQSAADTNLSRQHVKDPTDLPFVEPAVIARTKEIEALSTREHAVATCVVLGEDLNHRRIQRNQTRLAEFRSMDGKDTLRPVDIGTPQIERFADA